MSQDIVFSQYFNNPIYLNPSLTALQNSGRLYVNYRNAAIDVLDQRTYAVAADVPFVKGNAGVGFQCQWQQDGVVSNGVFGLQFSKKVALTQNTFLALGIEVGGYMSKINKSKIVLYEDLIGQQTSTHAYPSTLTYDFSAGMGLNYKSHYFGFSVRHLTQPLIKSKSVETLVNRKYTVHYASRIKLMSGKNHIYLSPQAIFDYQKGNNHLTSGVYLFYNYIGLGMFVRDNLPLHISTLIGFLSFKTKNIDISYSFDFPLVGIGIETGVHEIGLKYYLPGKNNQYHDLETRNSLSF